MKLRKYNKDKALSKLSNKNNKKLKIGTIICSICLLVGAIIYLSFARFESSNSYSLINGTVVDSGDVKIISYMYDDGSGDVTNHNVPPLKNDGYVIDQVTCTNANGTWDNTNWSLSISNITGKVKCNLSFKPLYRVISGNLSTVGSVVKIANEEFYVIGQQDSTHVKLLSKWNLNVGSNAKGTATNLQDSDVKGSDLITQYGTVPFSSTNYWSSTVSTYPAWVYTNEKTSGTYKASIAEYVDNYVIYLTQQGVSVTGRLIKQEELVALGCNPSTHYCDSIGSNGGTAPLWVYQTAYWSGSAGSGDSVWRVTSFGNFYYGGIDSTVFGVRPVIILAT
jgi:hypothetical protein